MEYATVSDTDQIKFNKKVNEMIESQWIPKGGVSISTCPDNNPYGSTPPSTIFVQAMIKETR